MRLVARHLWCVRQTQEAANILSREPEVAGVPHKCEALRVRRSITPLVAVRAFRPRQKTDLLIIAYRLDFYAGSFRQQSNRYDPLSFHSLISFLLEPLVSIRCG